MVAALVMGQMVFFMLIVLAAHIKVGDSKQSVEDNRLLREEVTRLNQRNVELIAELSSLRYR